MYHDIYVSTFEFALDVEPFDEALDRHIWSLADNRLNWHTNIAAARRTKPTAISTVIRDVFGMQAEKDAQAPPPIVHVADEEEGTLLVTEMRVYLKLAQMMGYMMQTYNLPLNKLPPSGTNCLR